MVVLLGLNVLTAKADVAILVHGYLGSAASWEYSGVYAALIQGGWQPAGVLTPQGLIVQSNQESFNQFYAVELPSRAPVALQAQILGSMLNQVHRRHPDEPMVLIGHSAGGVVARMALVVGGVPQPKALVTIASPHLGTLRALQALDETDDVFPISMIKDFFAGDLYRAVRDSWGVLLDLTPERPGNLLFWLNHQPHPDIRYVSIVRSGPIGMGDELVPAYSQDMNQVNSLSRLSEIRVTQGGHQLHPMDGTLLIALLTEL
jgi:pimeloyl-ACP methyl ester carboxylesterase